MKKLSLYTSLIGLIFMAGSCKKVTENLNTNPNAATSVPYVLQLNGAMVAGMLIYEGQNARVGGIFDGTFSGVDRQYVALQNYNTTSTDYNDTWDNVYSIVIAQYQIVEAQAAAVNDKITVGITQTLLAQAFGMAADVWGDIPFSQVGNPTLYPKPAFDKQMDVYAGVIKLLDSAIINLNSNVGNGPGVKDYYYQGNPASWLPVANTLLARYLLHTKDYADAILAATQGISSAAGNMMDPHSSDYLVDFNVYYSFLSYDRPGYMNSQGAYAPSLLNPASPNYRGNAKTNETARFNYLWQVGLNTSGLDPNVDCQFDGWVSSSTLDGFFGGATSFPLVTFSENQLILAESYLKQSSPNMALALAALNTHRAYMNTGGYINTGYQSLGVMYAPYTLADFAPGGMVNPTSSGQTQQQALLKEILTEKYVTLIGQIEQFTDLRRTHNYIGVPPNVGTQLPQRFLYGQDEVNTNPNTPAQPVSILFVPTTANSTPY
jgi:starch-binding outer membrane protein, SusD/RagB family